MIQQTLLAMETAIEVSQSQMAQSLECDYEEALENVKSILVDAAVEVAALIDAVCCRWGEWVDWQRYRPHPRISVGNDEDPDSIIRLALTESNYGLRAGGYIEMCVRPKERLVEANGGYYDVYRQPKPVIDGSLHWHEVNHQSLGQAMMLMYDRILREYTERAEFVEDQRCHVGFWAKAPLLMDCAAIDDGVNPEAIGAMEY